MTPPIGRHDPTAMRAALEAGNVSPEDGVLLWAADAALALRPHLHMRWVGVAVSGGSDSMATLWLLAQLHDVEAVTVNHGLRPEAEAEAEFVAQFCAAHGIPHTTLKWEGTQAQGNLMDAARRARLQLIGDWARRRGLGAVALGHTADDQAETFLMRLSREAGLEGLSGMRESFEAEGMLWLRPFLLQSRADLRRYLERQGIGWVEDPSNQNDRYDRVKARQALRVLRPLGISVAKLNAVVGHLAMAEQAVGFSLRRLAEEHVQEAAGDVLVDAWAFRNLFDAETSRRLVNAALMWISGADYPPRAAKVLDFLMSWRTRRDCTLHGCRITVSDDTIRFTREAKAVTGLRVPVGQDWDRWRLDGPLEDGFEIAALGAEGLKQIKTWRDSGLPRPTLLASPAVWRGETLVSAPLAGRANGYSAHIVRGSFANALIRR
ncbi:tRNA lysidine(34) synthetase TilS [Rhodobacter aestuarii]|nr:tRNA lysidine(34) synthetase TilS [Rhodobacter aestuarii]